MLTIHTVLAPTEVFEYIKHVDSKYDDWDYDYEGLYSDVMDKFNGVYTDAEVLMALPDECAAFHKR